LHHYKSIQITKIARTLRYIPHALLYYGKHRSTGVS
ncbi:MAG: hypothetical protein ACI90V_009233, partial [Bacillariaceae sp.]